MTQPISLKQLRKERGLTQAQVAIRMHVSQARVSSIENRAFDMTRIATVTSYVRALGGATVVQAVFGDLEADLGGPPPAFPAAWTGVTDDE
jgi:transcriptional regulator with XRE-family HTH domain